jgi:hemoglobin
MQDLFDRIGSEGFEKLTRVFYEGVANDPLLKPMYPEEDLGPAERRLRMFLEQYWGGPDTYQQERGHPRLRMRHYEFKIGPKARDAWLEHMKSAVDSLELSELDHNMLWDYLERAAHAMLNTFEEN